MQQILRLLSLVVLLSAVAALPAQGKKKGGGGGTTPPPADPAIAFQSDGTLFVMNTDGSNLRVVVSNATTKVTMEPAWSPDSSEIAFVGTPGGLPNGIWAVKPDGSGLRRIAVLPAGVDTDLSWSPSPTPDGRKKIAYLAPGDPNANPQSYEVFLANADGSGTAQLTSTADFEMELCWAPDGARMAVTALAMNDGAKPYCAVLSIGIDSSQQLVVTGTTEVTRVAGSPLQASDGINWLIFDPDWARESDRLLLSVRKPGFGFDLWIVDLANPASPLRLNVHNDAESAGCWSPDDTRICYRRAGGGRKADGLYTVASNGTGATQILRGGRHPDWRRTR